MSQKISLARMSGGTGTYLQQRACTVASETAGKEELKPFICMQAL
jgi:hypothetical protein